MHHNVISFKKKKKKRLNFLFIHWYLNLHKCHIRHNIYCCIFVLLADIVFIHVQKTLCTHGMLIWRDPSLVIHTHSLWDEGLKSGLTRTLAKQETWDIAKAVTYWFSCQFRSAARTIFILFLNLFCTLNSKFELLSVSIILNIYQQPIVSWCQSI